MPEQPDIPSEATLDQLDRITAAMLREGFRDSYQGGFGEPVPADIEARTETAHSLELKEWMPNRLDAESPEELFTSSLEAALAGFPNDLLQRKFGIERGATTSLTGREERLPAYSEAHPGQSDR